MGKVLSIAQRRGESPSEKEADFRNELNELCETEPEAGKRPALAMSGTQIGKTNTVTVSPVQFAKLAGVGHNLVRAWCHLPGFPVHREGWRFHINVELGVKWLRERAVAREGVDDQSLGHIR